MTPIGRPESGPRPALSTSDADRPKEALGILAGRGSLPVHVAKAAAAAGRPVHIVALKGMASEEVESFPHTWASIGQIGRMLTTFGKTGCRDIVIIGGATRPNFSELRVDLGTLVNLPTLLTARTGGDDNLLTRVIAFFEGKGLHVVGAHEIAPDLLAPMGALGKYEPTPEDLEDIETGLAVSMALGAHDVGQAVVVSRGHVLAVEAAEGTDAMLERCVGLKKWGIGRRKPRAGVLVKSAKPGQDRRIDLPSIGPETVRRAVDAHLAGIAVVAGDVLIAEREEVIRLANQNRLFVAGVPSRAASDPTSGS